MNNSLKIKIRNPKKIKVRYNPDLDKYEDVILFPEKVALAEKILKNVKLPKALTGE